MVVVVQAREIGYGGGYGSTQTERRSQYGTGNTRGKHIPTSYLFIHLLSYQCVSCLIHASIIIFIAAIVSLTSLLDYLEFKSKWLNCADRKSADGHHIPLSLHMSVFWRMSSCLHRASKRGQYTGIDMAFQIHKANIYQKHSVYRDHVSQPRSVGGAVAHLQNVKVATLWYSVGKMEELLSLTHPLL